jgi:sugar lactone lactonase YvrE
LYFAGAPAAYGDIVGELPAGVTKPGDGQGTMTKPRSRAATLSCRAGLALLASIPASLPSAAQDALFESHQLTPNGEYTRLIEGPGVDTSGNLYVVNFRNDGTIGKLAPGAARSELFASLPVGSIGNGIRFDRDGRMYVADFKKHNVFVINRGETQPHVYFHSAAFNQPNDLAIAADGTLYASDPRFPHNGQIWRIARQPDGTGRGGKMTSDRPTMGATNGIDLSPDGATLYISESDTREVWAYGLDGDKLLNPRMLKKFDAFELDGLRTDLDGKIFVARPGAGSIAVLTPDGNLVREVTLRGKGPSNLSFGGPDGKTVFVTQTDGRFIEAFRTDRAGREPCLQGAAGSC